MMEGASLCDVHHHYSPLAIVAPCARTDRKQPGEGSLDAGHQPDHPV